MIKVTIPVVIEVFYLTEEIEVAQNRALAHLEKAIQDYNNSLSNMNNRTLFLSIGNEKQVKVKKC